MRTFLTAVFVAVALLSACGDEGTSTTVLDGGQTVWEVRSNTVVAVGHETGGCSPQDEPLLPASVSADYRATSITITVVPGRCDRTDVDGFAVGAGIQIELTEAIDDRDVSVILER